MSSIPPIRAAVRPRVFAREGDAVLLGDSVLLEDEVGRLLDAGQAGLFRLTGESGSGKTTALQHLAAVFCGDEHLYVAEDPDWQDYALPTESLILFTGNRLPRQTGELYLAPWTQDELIEYLLARHKEQCKSVMARVRAEGLEPLNAELWAIVLERLANDAQVPDVIAALVAHVESTFADAQLRTRYESICTELLTEHAVPAAAYLYFEKLSLPEPHERLLRTGAVQLLLSARGIVRELPPPACKPLTQHLPRKLVQTVAADVAGNGKLVGHLRVLADSVHSHQAMAVSVLHEAHEFWRPGDSNPPILDGAYLSAINWPGVRLKGTSLKETDLTRANLRGADLSECHAQGVRLDGADLRRANLTRFLAFDCHLYAADLSGAIADGAAFAYGNLTQAQFQHASLKNACLTNASLRRAVFQNADLTRAVLLKSQISGADFTQANLKDAILSGLPLRHAVLTGVNLKNARMRKCDLQEVNLDGVSFESAVLDGSDLTGGSFERANLAGASLQNTGLADVNMEGACLRGADLRDATFHMGSSRSGLLFTPIASEGTRTGFYTDESGEHFFQAPEHVRKANLRFADLREARVFEVDFYLVDLRGALYDEHQEAHFRRCRAILDDWAGNGE